MLLVLPLVLGLFTVPPDPLVAGPQQTQVTPAQQEAFLQHYCVGCHAGTKAPAGLRLDDVSLEQISANPELWEKVIRKLRAGAMPPLGLPRPERSVMDAFTTSIESAIDRDAKPNPGPSALHRLNRAEYAAAVRDLLNLEVDVAPMLPADDANRGFDNMADSLHISPALLEGYLKASRKISQLAVGDRETAPGFSAYSIRPDAPQDGHIDGLPLGTRGGALIQHYFPLDGQYVFKTKLLVNSSGKVRGLDFPHEFLITIDGVKVLQTTIGGQDDEALAYKSPPESEASIESRMEIKLPVKAGPHALGVTFRMKTSAQSDGLLQPYQRSQFDPQEQRGVPIVESISVGGPFEASGPGDTPSRRKIFSCRPHAGTDPVPCAKTILSTLLRQAYRRPIVPADLETPLNFFQSGSNASGSGDAFDAGIESSLRFILTSPEFLFRTEHDPSGSAPGSIYRVSDLELASRLSFFLWSSGPDEELLTVADRGKLKDPIVLEKQVRRMLEDKRA